MNENLLEDMQNAQVLMSDEVAFVLKTKRDMLIRDSGVLPELTDRTFQYCESIKKFKSPEEINEVRNLLEQAELRILDSVIEEHKVAFRAQLAQTQEGGLILQGQDEKLRELEDENIPTVKRLNSYEIAAICNLDPQSAEEAKKLIESLHVVENFDLDNLLQKIKRFRFG